MATVKVGSVVGVDRLPKRECRWLDNCSWARKECQNLAITTSDKPHKPLLVVAVECDLVQHNAPLVNNALYSLLRHQIMSHQSAQLLT
jgi:hypothetical protein